MPEAIAHYKILGHLGAGGLGEVYRARDTRLGRTVAVKVFPAELMRDEPKLQFLLETAKLLAEVSHPNIAMLFESGRTEISDIWSSSSCRESRWERSSTGGR